MMLDMQKFVDALGDAARRSRSDYHLTLGGAISALEKANPTAACVVDNGGAPGRVGSYRGYYADLAFTPSGAATVADVLTDLRAALGETFLGYKGGDFVMGEDTPLWVSPYGMNSGLAVVGISDDGGVVTLLTKQLNE